MTVLATDDFNRANGGLGANWGGSPAPGDGAPDILSNECRFAADPCAAYYTAVIPSTPDYYCKVTLRTMIGAGDGAGPMVRCSSSVDTKYFLSCNTSNTQLFKVVTGTFTQLGSNGVAAATGQVAEINAVGTAITAKINGATIIGPITDSAIAAAGQGGVFGSNGGVNPTVDDWEMGDFAGGTVPNPLVAPLPNYRTVFFRDI